MSQIFKTFVKSLFCNKVEKSHCCV